jgi:hypothetical protein
MLNLALAALLLTQGSPDDPPAVTSTLDSAVKGISSYKSSAKPIGDEAFLKRLMPDLVDAAPTAAELKSFVDDPDPKKRAKKIHLLLDDPRFAPFWADRFAKVFFGDLDKVQFLGLGPLKEGFEPTILPAFRKWLAARIQKDKPWTEIVNQILDARGTAEGDAALAYKLSRYREPGMEQAFAEGVSRHFLGIRLTCARCHDHPFDKWTMEDYYGLAAYVSGQRAERVDGVPQIRYASGGTLEIPGLKLPKTADVRSISGTKGPQFLFGGKTEPTDDYMQSLAGFMTDRRNTQLPRALANRVWGWLMGWGVAHPVDDFNLKNKALSPALLEAMVRDLVDNGYSLKRLIRSICNTQEYQLPLPSEDPENSGFRQIASRKFGLGRYEPYLGKGPRLAVSLTVPESWISVRPRFGGGGGMMTYRVPDPKDGSRNAELHVFEGKESHETNVGQFQKPKTGTAAVEGKLKFALSEVTGGYACRSASDGPLDYTVVTARAELPKGSVATVRLEGPADLVASLREEFIALLKTATLR